MQKRRMKPIAAAIGTAFVASLAASSIANASTNPFTAIPLSSGYSLAQNPTEGCCGEGKCGEGKCGSAECQGGGDDAKGGEGKCGEGKCGGDKAAGEGKCGGAA